MKAKRSIQWMFHPLLKNFFAAFHTREAFFVKAPHSQKQVQPPHPIKRDAEAVVFYKTGPYPSIFFRFSSSEFVTTETELNAMAAPATMGLSSPNAASGTPMVL